MAEALGLGASALAFIAIAAQLSKAILAVCGTIRETPREIDRVANRLGTLKFILEDVHILLDTPGNISNKDTAFLTEQFDQLWKDFGEYKKLAEKLTHALENKDSTLGARSKFLWFFKREEIKELGGRIETHVKTFETVLAFRTNNIVRNSSFDIHEIKRTVENFKPVTKEGFESEMSILKTDLTRCLQQAIPSGPRHSKTTSSSKAVKITARSSTWHTYHLPVGTLRVIQSLKRSGRHEGNVDCQETTSEVIFNFTPKTWFIDKATVGLFGFQHKQYDDIPKFTHMSWSFNVLPEKHAAFSAVADGDIPRLQELFEKGLARPNDRQARGFSLLHMAADKKLYDMSLFLIRQGADCTAVDEDGGTILHHLLDQLLAEKREEIQRLVSLYNASGCDFTAVDRTGRSAFSQGLLLNLITFFSGPYDREAFHRIFESLQDLDEIDYFDPLPLVIAMCTAYSGRPSSQKLLEGPVTRWLKSNWKGVYDLSEQGSYRKVLLQALEHKAKELTPVEVDLVLRYPCSGEAKSACEIIERLVRPGIAAGDSWDLDEVLEVPALCLAAEHGNLEAVEILLAAGADPTAPGNEDAFYHAVSEGHLHVARRLLDFNYCTPTSFSLAVSKGHIDLASTFIERGLEINQRGLGKLNETILFSAARSGHLEMVDFLLKNGADVLAQNAMGDRPSAVAIKNKHASVHELLAKEEGKALLTQKPKNEIIPMLPASEILPRRWVEAVHLKNQAKKISRSNFRQEPHANDLPKHSQHRIDSLGSFKTLAAEDMLLITGGVVVTLWGYFYIFLGQAGGFLWRNRAYVTVGRIKIVLWILCSFSSFTLFIGYLLGRRW